MIYLLSLILLLLPTYLIRFTIFTIPTTVLEILIYIVFIFGVFLAIKKGFRSIPLKILLPIGLLIAALTISTLISPDKRVALGEFKGFFVDPILFFWLIYQFVETKNLSGLWGALIVSGFFVTIHTFVQKFSGGVTADGRVIGIFGYSPNYVALYLAPITVLAIALSYKFLTRKKYLSFLGLIFLVVLNLTAIYFSGSRGGILAVGAGVGIFVIVNFWSWIRQRISSQIIIAILVLMAIYTSWFLFKPDFTVTKETGGRIATSNNLRWEIWRTSIELGQKHPILGVGLGNYQNAFGELTKDRGNFPEYITPQAFTPHNIFLMFWLSTGVLGLIAFLWLIFEFYRQVIRKFQASETAAIFAVFFSIIAYGLIESSIWKNDLGVIFWFFWGLIWIL